MTDKPVSLRFKLPAADEAEFYAKFSQGVTRGGMFIATGNPKPVGTLVAFEFVLSDGRPLISGEGRVESVTEKKPGARGGMTLRFTRLDGESLQRVDRAVAAAKGQDAVPLPAQEPAPAAARDDASEERRRRHHSSVDAARARFACIEPVLGIDLGTTNCRAAVYFEGQCKLLALEGRSPALPSVVAFDEKGRQLVGTRAKAQLLVDPRSAILGAKRLLGRRARSAKVLEIAARSAYEIVADEAGDAAVQVAGQLLSPTRIAASLLTEIRNRASDELGRPVGRAVICVPAYFNDRQRQAARDAGSLAGLEVELVLTEPTAVAIAYGYGRALARKRLFVFDLGGGTFDASVIAATGDDFEVLAAGGDDFLGGLDFDLRLAGWLEEQLSAQHGCPPLADPLMRQRVRDAAETAKIALSGKEEVRVHLPYVAVKGQTPLDLDVQLARGRFEALTEDLVLRSIGASQAVLDAAHVSPRAVDEVVLVGGQSQSPRIRAALAELFGRPVEVRLDPHDAVASGAALAGEALRADDPTIFALQFSEVLTLGVGIGLSDGRLWKVLERGTRLPCEKTVALPVAAEGAVRVAVYQGEGDRYEGAEYLGTLVVPAAGKEAEVSFSLSRDGLLSLAARTPEGGLLTAALATSDAPEALRGALLAAAPLPDPAAAQAGLLGGIRKLLGRRG